MYLIEMLIVFIIALVVSVPPLWFLLSVAGPQVTLIGFGVMVWLMVVFVAPGSLVAMYHKRKDKKDEK